MLHHSNPITAMNHLPNTNPYTSFRYRFFQNFTIKVLIGIQIFLFLLLVLLTSQNINFAPFAVFLLVGMGVTLFFASKGATYYVDRFRHDQEKIIISYYQKNEPKEVAIYWKDIDFCFSHEKSGYFLAIWNRNELVFRIFDTYGNNQKQQMDNLKTIFLQYIPQQRITQESNFLQKAPSVYTKFYSPFST